MDPWTWSGFLPTGESVLGFLLGGAHPRSPRAREEHHA